MGKTIKCKKAKKITKSNNISIDTLFNKLKISDNILVNKIYFETVKNQTYCIGKYGIRLNVVRWKESIGCSKLELCAHIMKSINSSININDFSTWKIGHVSAFDVEQKDNIYYVFSYLNFKNLIIEKK